MIQCQNCGQTNGYGSNFCRFCGTRMVIPQNAQPLQEEYREQPPRPYMWKTDEFQVRDNTARRTQEIRQVQPIPPVQPMYKQPQMNPQMNPVHYQNSAHPAAGYRCPRCGTPQFPVLRKKISTAGWIVFTILLIFFFPLFWIGLLIKEDVKVCPLCNFRVTWNG